MLARLINNLDPNFKIDKDLKDYLNNSLDPVENWGIYELAVFGNTTGVLDTGITCRMAKELMKRTKFFSVSFKSKQTLIRTFLNVSSNCIDKGLLEEAKMFMDHLATLMTKNNRLFFEHVILCYTKGFYLFKTGEKGKGIQWMERSVAIIEEMEYEETSEFYREHLKELVSEE
jgi:Rgg/GadR/MutR family transcriptional activator